MRPMCHGSNHILLSDFGLHIRIGNFELLAGHKKCALADSVHDLVTDIITLDPCLSYIVPMAFLFETSRKIVSLITSDLVENQLRF